MAKKLIRKWLAKPFIALGDLFRRWLYPTDMEKIAKVIPDREFTNEDLRNNIGIQYMGDVSVPKRKDGALLLPQGYRAIIEHEYDGLTNPLPGSDPYILVRTPNGHVKKRSTKSLKSPPGCKWDPNDKIEVIEGHDPELAHPEENS